MALLTAVIDPFIFFADLDNSAEGRARLLASWSRSSPAAATLALPSVSATDPSGDYLMIIQGSGLPDSLENPGLAAIFASVSQFTIARRGAPEEILFSWDGQGGVVSALSLRNALVSGGGQAILDVLLRGLDTLNAEYETVDISTVDLLENVTLFGEARDVIGSATSNVIRGNQLNNLIFCGDGNDEARGFDGNDTIDGGAGVDRLFGGLLNDLLTGDADDDGLRGGNGRDTLIGGSGRDELWGDFGRNVFLDNEDGESDLLVIKSDQIMFNSLLGGVDDSEGLKSDVIGAIDLVDRIILQGVSTEEISFEADYSWISLNGGRELFTGIAIFALGKLEAIYVGGVLSLEQLQQITSGDASEAALNSTLGFYGSW